MMMIDGLCLAAVVAVLAASAGWAGCRAAVPARVERARPGGTRNSG